MTRRLDPNALTRWITAAAIEQPGELTSLVVKRCGVARSTARRAIERLVEAHWLVREGSGPTLLHRPGPLRQVVQHYGLANLDENMVWQCDFARAFALPEPLLQIVRCLFCELLNNAIRHSGGDQVTVSVRQTPAHVHLLVSDNGRGLFDSIDARFGLKDPMQAMSELASGKLSTQAHAPGAHGLHFAVCLADVIELHANGAAFRSHAQPAPGVSARSAMPCNGTSVFAAVSLDTERSIESVIDARHAAAAATS